MSTEFYNETRNSSIDNADRYKNCKVLEDISTGEKLLATREIVDIDKHPNDRYHEVQSHEVARLDILAAKYYNNPLLWWVLAQANDIYDPMTPIAAGSIIRIPYIETLYGNNGLLL